ncbi:MAG: glycine oxidase ThiO [Myxococcales bacterium]|nr:glycine oxidase ThiO [Myxococcales bacterium]
MTSTRIVVLGGGLVGSLVALRLADAGLSVLVLEKAVPGAEASSAAAGILAAQAESHSDGPMAQLALESRALHAQLSDELRARIGLDSGYRRVGTLELACTPEALDALWRRSQWQRDAGLSVDLLEPDALREREPKLSAEWAGGVAFGDDGVVDPPRLVAAVAECAARAGVVFRAGVTARGLRLAGGRCVGVETDQGLVEGDLVVVCAGAWSGLIEGALPRAERVRPARGQVIEIEARPVPIGSVVYAEGGYLVPRSDGHVYVGSTLEFVGFRRGVTVAGMTRLTRLASAVVPALSEGVISRSWSNFRPFTDDHAPLVGHRETPGLIVATGHYRSGILLAPVTAEIVRELVRDGHSRRNVTPLAPARAMPGDAP